MYISLTKFTNLNPSCIVSCCDISLSFTFCSWSLIRSITLIALFSCSSCDNIVFWDRYGYISRTFFSYSWSVCLILLKFSIVGSEYIVNIAIVEYIICIAVYNYSLFFKNNVNTCYWFINHGTRIWTSWYMTIIFMVQTYDYYGTKLWLLWYKTIIFMLQDYELYGRRLWTLWYKTMNCMVQDYELYGTRL